jgi:hypothetical protein
MSPAWPELIAELISFSCMVMFLVSPDVLTKSPNFRVINYYIDFGPFWFIIFGALFFAHIWSVYADGRSLRRITMAMHAGWASFLTAAAVITHFTVNMPDRPIISLGDLYFGLYLITSFSAWIQLDTGRPIVMAEQIPNIRRVMSGTETGAS